MGRTPVKPALVSQLLTNLGVTPGTPESTTLSTELLRLTTGGLRTLLTTTTVVTTEPKAFSSH